MEKQKYWLVGADSVTANVRLPLEGPILIGRGAYNHVVLKDYRISRQHSRVSPESDRNVVYDLSSTNGTFVNDQPVTRRVLEPNDVIRVGPLAFRIEPSSTDERRQAHPADLEKPTLRDLGSVSRVLAGTAPRESSTQLPVVDLGQLEDAYDKLDTLYSFMQAICKTIDRRELVELIAEQLRTIYSSSKVIAIYLVSREPGSSALHLAHHVSRTKTTELPTLLPAVATALVEGAGAVFGGSGMLAPMVDRGETLGVIQVVGDDRLGRFTRADLDLLNAIAAPAAIMLQNARIHDELLVRDRLRHDLDLAVQIQKSFLPREVLRVEGVELFAEYRAAYSVGGDFYDVFWVAGDRLGVFIGDIAGKGISGALLMARISSELRVAALEHVEPVKVLATMNEALLARKQAELFFTAIYLTLDSKTGKVVFANAGHPVPYLLRADRSVTALSEGAAAPVGILEDPGFTQATVTLEHGDSLVLYTDGVIEAADLQDKLYGVERLESCLLSAGTRPADIAEHIMNSVQRHSADRPFRDDVTLFICQRNVGARPSLQPRRRSGMLQSPKT